MSLRQIHRLAAGGVQIPILTSRTDLPAAEVCWRLSARWRQENYFKYAREHFALDALDSYAAIADDPHRLVPNPAKKHTRVVVEAARAALSDAQAGLAAAIADATARARQPGSGATAAVDPAATHPHRGPRPARTGHHPVPAHPQPPAPGSGPTRYGQV